MAHGDFSQRVDVDRNDEVGRLARAFTSMSQRVGERDQQMRALLANVSHDLKTPMTSITGYAQALADGTASPRRRSPHRRGARRRGAARKRAAVRPPLPRRDRCRAGHHAGARTSPLDEVVGRCVRRIEPVGAREGDRAWCRPRARPDAEGRRPRQAGTGDHERARQRRQVHARRTARSASSRATKTAPARRSSAPSRTQASSIPDDDLPRIFDRFFRSDRARRTASAAASAWRSPASWWS